MSLSNRWSVWSVTLLAAAALAACGGKTPTPLGPVLTGQFLDGPVEGLGYRTATGGGFTNAQGEFSYRAGESVTFFIGDMELPPVQAAPVVTPLDVAGTDNLHDPMVVNLLVLLQSLGVVGNVSDTIQIPTAVTARAGGQAGRALGEALRTDPATFLTTLSGSPVLDGQSPVDEQTAIQHFAKTLMLEVPDRAFTTDQVIVARARAVGEDGSEMEPGVDRQVRIRFDGRNLDDGLTAEASGMCTAVQSFGTVTDSAIEFTCRPSGVGPLTVTLRSQDEIVGTYSGTVGEPLILLETTLGNLTIELDTTRAPVTSANFLSYVDNGYYSNTVFHRVISGFMVQGGGCVIGQTPILNGGCVSGSSTVQQKGGNFPPIDVERTSTTGLSNVAGSVAMARTDVEKSATSQFFINVVDNSSFLDANTNPKNPAGYAVFGRVVEGADSTLQSIRFLPVQPSDLPVNPPVILSATRVR